MLQRRRTDVSCDPGLEWRQSRERLHSCSVGNALCHQRCHQARKDEASQECCRRVESRKTRTRLESSWRLDPPLPAKINTFLWPDQLRGKHQTKMESNQKNDSMASLMMHRQSYRKNSQSRRFWALNQLSIRLSLLMQWHAREVAQINYKMFRTHGYFISAGHSFQSSINHLSCGET